MLVSQPYKERNKYLIMDAERNHVATITVGKGLILDKKTYGKADVRAVTESVASIENAVTIREIELHSIAIESISEYFPVIVKSIQALLKDKFKQIIIHTPIDYANYFYEQGFNIHRYFVSKPDVVLIKSTH